MSKYTVDLNCDMGESFGPWKMGDDKAILPYVSSANIACGFHAGDPSIMLETIRMVVKFGVNIGAHPGFQDLIGFGRRAIQVTPKEVYALMVYQMGAMLGCARAVGTAIHHVKPHGALYTMAAGNRELAEAVAQAVYDVDPKLILFGLSGSESIKAGRAKGLKVFNEVFADRTYQANGTLTPRTEENALIYKQQDAVDQVVHMVRKGKVMTLQGTEISIQADTVCLHGDNPDAIRFAIKINQALRDQEIAVG